MKETKVGTFKKVMKGLFQWKSEFPISQFVKKHLGNSEKSTILFLLKNNGKTHFGNAK